MAAFNAGTTGSSRRAGSNGGRGSLAVSKTVSASSNSSENNSPETSSGGSFSGSGRGSAEGAPTGAAATSSSVGLRRSGGSPTGGAGNKKKRFVGVRQRPSGRWVAEIKDTTQKIRLWLGTFDTAEDAARAYDEAAWLLRGANTRTNFVPSPNTEPPALPSKAARLLQLRRNAAAKSGNSPAPSNNNSSSSSSKQDQQPVSQSTTVQKSANVSRSDSNSKPISRSQAVLSASVVAKPKLETVVKEEEEEEEDDEVDVPHNTKVVAEIESKDISTEEVSKSESDSIDDSSEAMEMDGIEQSPAPEYNATSSPSSCLTNQSDDGQSVFVASDDSASRRDIIVKQEIPRREIIVKQEYIKTRESSAIRENRKDNDYCVEPQENFVDDTDMSSGLSCLDDVDLSCEDSVYSSSPFDFSADMGTIDLGSFIPSAYSAEEDPTFFSEQMRRLSYERKISANLYAMNGVHECLSLSSHSSLGSDSFGMASPSLTLAAGFRRSSSGPFLTASPVVWKREGSGSNGSSWGNQVSNSSSTSTGNGSGESVESPREDALWQSWDLSPLCVVA